MLWVVESSGGPVCWIVAAGDVACCDAADATGQVKERVDMFEYGVDSSVAVSADAPAFDDAGVVAVENDVVTVRKDGVESADKELKGNGLGPANVLGSVEGMPVCTKTPGAPAVPDGDTNFNTRTGIGIGVGVEKSGWGEN